MCDNSCHGMAILTFACKCGMMRLMGKEAKQRVQSQKEIYIEARKRHVLKNELIRASMLNHCYLSKWSSKVRLLCPGFREEVAEIVKEYDGVDITDPTEPDNRPKDCGFCCSPCGQYFNFTDAELCFLREMAGLGTPTPDALRRWWKDRATVEEITQRVNDQVDADMARREAAAREQ